MQWLAEFVRRLRYRAARERFDEDLAEEMKLHLALRSEEKQAGGMPADEAEAAARRQFGNVTRAAERSRESWGWTFLDTVAQDLRYGWRSLAANPGFTATAVLSLALGIGANTAIFGIVNALMLRTLPVPEPGSLMVVKYTDGEYFTNPLWEQVRDHQQSFSGALAYLGDRFNLANGGESHFANGLWVSGEFFRTLGVPALRGRVFTQDDDRHGGGVAGPVAVISYRFWKGHFNGDPDVVGRTVRLNRQPFQIVGVTPPWFTGLEPDRKYDVAIPIGCDPILRADRSLLAARSAWWLHVLGRLKAGESAARAEAGLRAIAPEVMRAALPLDWRPKDQKAFLAKTLGLAPAATGFSDTRGSYRKALFALMTIVALVLLIACANIANLLLARASARERELAVRMAIGAARWRVVRQLMTESLLLSLAGAAGGLLLALWGSRLLVQLISTTGREVELDLTPDVRVLGFTIGAAALTALLFGLAPALRATRIGVGGVLKENSRGAVRGSSRHSLGKLLVAGQVALSLLLLVGAGLFLGTLRNLMTVDAGFDQKRLLLVNADCEHAGVQPKQRVQVFTQLLERLRALPGVRSASTSMLTPISGFVWNGPAAAEGFQATSDEDMMVFFNRVSPGYFETMRTPLVAGREFNSRDTLNAPHVIILGAATARHFFGAANPIGKLITIETGPNQKEALQVVGVVKDSKYERLNEATLRTAFFPTAQDTEPWPNVSFQIRSDMPLDMLQPAIAAAVAEVNRSISLEFRSLDAQVNESLAQPRMVALLASVFGALALLLAMVGLYGVTAYAVERRQGEIGIRMALGAQRGAVIWLVLRDVLVLLVAGTVVGLAAALASGRLVASLLYGLRPNDPAQLAGAALVLAVATALAAWLPARRAARLDPMAALREE
ncbi:MAG TPA: ABC transporter permease [Bryobacteraceae bacterium]|nr:ABC transporter permease [Bryobacteraceae bacterium]